MFVISVLRVPQLSVEEMRGAGVFCRLQRYCRVQPTDHMGKTFDRSSINGRWSLFWLCCPDVKLTSMSVLGRVDRQSASQQPGVGGTVSGHSPSVDPERDSTEPGQVRDRVLAPLFRRRVRRLGRANGQVNVVPKGIPDEPPPSKVLLLMSQPMLIPSITQAISSLSIQGPLSRIH